MKSNCLSLSRSKDDYRRNVVADLEASGLSAVTFARQHGLCYATLLAWRKRFADQASPASFIEVDLSAATSDTGLVIELGASARLRLQCATQIPLAVQLLKAL